MSDENTTTQQDDGAGGEDNEWGSPVRIRKGTRRRLENLIGLLTGYPGIASLPDEVRVVFRDAFANARNSFSPDVLIDTAVAATLYMLTQKPRNVRTAPPSEVPSAKKGKAQR